MKKIQITIALVIVLLSGLLGWGIAQRINDPSVGAVSTPNYWKKLSNSILPLQIANDFGLGSNTATSSAPLSWDTGPSLLKVTNLTVTGTCTGCGASTTITSFAAKGLSFGTIGGTFSHISSLSLEPNSFSISNTASNGFIRLNWGASGVASRSATNTWSALNKFTAGASVSGGTGLEVSANASVSGRFDLTGNASVSSNFEVTGSGYASSSVFYSGFGSAGVAAFAFAGERNTGIFRNGASTLGLMAAGNSLNWGSTFFSTGSDVVATLGQVAKRWTGVFTTNASISTSFEAQGTASISSTLRVFGNTFLNANASISTNFEVGGYASVSGPITEGTIVSNSFLGSLTGKTTGTLSVGTSNNPLKILWSNIIQAVVSFFFPSYTATSLAGTGNSAIQTASKSLDFNDSSVTKVIDGLICPTFVVDSPTSANPSIVGPIRIGDPITIVSVATVASGSNAAGYNVVYGAPGTLTTNVFSSSHSASTSAYFTYTTFANSTLTDDQVLAVKITSRSAVLQTFSVTVCYRKNH